MTAPYYERHGVTVLAGDCLDVLRTLPDGSVDAVICDPPYGLADHKPAAIVTALTAWANGDRDHVPDGRGFMGRDWDAFVPPPAVWDECLRVLKPGGHLAAFAGSRTVDLMGLSIRMAGFEIRDSLAWLMGSGFPKSLDVSKAIDKARGDDPAWKAVGAWLKEHRVAAGFTRQSIAPHLGGHKNLDSAAANMSNWENGLSFPTWERWQELRGLIGFGDEMDAEVWRLNGRKGTQGNERADRVVTTFDRDTYSAAVDVVNAGTPVLDAARQWQGWGTALKPAHEPIVCAQKPFSAVPSWDVVNTLHHALGGLLWLSASPAKRAELSSTSSPHALPEDACASALAAAVLGTSRGKSATTATFNSQALASTSSNIATSWSVILAALSGQTRTFTTATASSTTTALQTLNSLLAPITSPTTMPRCACLTGGSTSPAQSADDSSSDAWARWRHTQSASAPESAIEGIALAVSSALASVAEQLSNEQAAASTAQQSAQTGPPMSGDSSLSGLANAAGSSSSLAETLAASARSTAQGSPSTAGSRPAHEPIVLARKPLGGTVAASVLQHGTGAINIDACRVPASDKAKFPTGHGKSGSIYSQDAYTKAWTTGEDRDPSGRWPSNVLLSHHEGCGPDGQPGPCVDGCPVADLDQQSGTLSSGTLAAHHARAPKTAGILGAYGSADGERGYGDQGGASRFFPTFRWEAKAPTSERPQVDGIAHPTVKPIALMRWLVRLLTPPGGLVLDPFAGSGATLHAARAEGMRSIGIEREPDYLRLIAARLDARPRAAEAPAEAVDPSEPMDLLDLLGGEAS